MVSLIQHDCTLHGWACMAWKSRGSPEAPTDLPSRTSCCSYVTVSVVLRLVMVLDFIDAGSNFNIGLCQNNDSVFHSSTNGRKVNKSLPSPPERGLFRASGGFNPPNRSLQQHFGTLDPFFKRLFFFFFLQKSEQHLASKMQLSNKVSSAPLSGRETEIRQLWLIAILKCSLDLSLLLWTAGFGKLLSAIKIVLDLSLQGSLKLQRYTDKEWREVKEYKPSVRGEQEADGCSTFRDNKNWDVA